MWSTRPLDTATMLLFLLGQVAKALGSADWYIPTSGILILFCCAIVCTVWYIICNLAALVSLVIGLMLYARFAIHLLICRLIKAHPNHTMLAKIASDGILSPVVLYTSILNIICTRKISILIAMMIAILVMTNRSILFIILAVNM